jgi:UDP-N-acetylbacillosamine N-acetyltransferase
MSDTIYIFGYSSHSYVIIDSIISCGMTIGGYFDLSKKIVNPYGIPYCGSEKRVDIKMIVKDNAVFPAVGDNTIRQKLIEFFESQGLRQAIIIDPSALVSPLANISPSVYVGKGAKINAMASIEKGSIINTGAIVEHECIVGAYSHVAPSSTICGSVVVGNRTLIGANSVLIQGISVHDDCIIGAGSVILRNTSGPFEKWVGNPARRVA